MSSRAYNSLYGQMNGTWNWVTKKSCKGNNKLKGDLTLLDSPVCAGCFFSHLLLTLHIMLSNYWKCLCSQFGLRLLVLQWYLKNKTITLKTRPIPIIPSGLHFKHTDYLCRSHVNNPVMKCIWAEARRKVETPILVGFDKVDYGAPRCREKFHYF